MSNTTQQRRILQGMQRHFEEGRLGLRDLTEHLRPEELRLLRQRSDEECEWSQGALERLTSLVVLGDRRRLELRPRQDSAAREVLAFRVLLIGFDAAERRHVTRLLEQAPKADFQLRAVESLEQARIALQQSAYDAALLNLEPSAGSGASQLARAEAVTSGIPVVLLASQELEPELVDIGAHHHLLKSKVDPRSLACALCDAIDQHRATGALASSQEKDDHAATRDALTGLPTRSSFGEHLQRALHYARRHDQQVAVLALDIDGFGAINEALGREVGDSLLLIAAERMQAALRRSDLVARVGPDEFLMLLQGREFDYAPARAAERLLECISRALVVGGSDHAMTASIGIAIHPQDGDDAEDLIRLADAAMQRVRGSGSNAYQFYGQAENAEEERRFRVADRLRGAVQRDELRVHYQPRVDARSGTIVGVEALLRWTDAEFGPVSPAEFIPIAERSGLMSEIGAWVMRESCLAHERWAVQGFGELRLSVNVSAQQVQSGSLRDALVDAVLGAGMAPTLLEIELTESALVDNQNTAAQLLRELAEIGVSLSLDDFGTGHSALSYLRAFPVRVLKIDPSFVREITGEPQAPSFLNAILALARTLDLGVVAEGVETEFQRDALLVRGCHEMQGYLFSPPVPEEQLVGLLRAGPLVPRV